MSQRIRLKEVSEKAGVAINTASTILNRRPNSWASKETEARVFAAAADLGYRPNKTARALRSGQFKAIGLLIQDMANPFFSTLADELEAAAEAQGYDLLIENARSSLVREKYLVEEMSELEVDAMVVWLSDTEMFRPFLAQQFSGARPLVVLGNGVPAQSYPVDAVLSDFTQGLDEAVASLCAKGHRRFAFLSALADGQSDGGRPRLFAEMLAQHGIPPENINFLRTGHTIDMAHTTFERFIRTQSHDLPTALVAMNDLAAVGAMRAAHELGLRVPADLSCIGVDDIPLASYLPVSLSSIRQRYRLIAAAAVDLIVQRLQQPATIASTPQQLIFPTQYRERESVTQAPRRESGISGLREQ